MEVKRRGFDFNSSFLSATDDTSGLFNNANDDADVAASERESSITKEDNSHWMQLNLENEKLMQLIW